MKKIIAIVLFLSMTVVSVSTVRAGDPDKVKSLLSEALKLYGDHQYVRALDLFKQAQALDPTNATADEYIKSTKQRILEWELQGNDPNDKKSNVNWDTLSQSSNGTNNDTATNAKDIIAARRSLVEKMKNRSTNTDDIVQIDQSAHGLVILLYQDQLFVPGLTTLRDEAMPILQHVADVIKGGDQTVTIKSATHTESEDPYLLYPEYALPARDPGETYKKSAGEAATSNFQDLEMTRSLILFTYLAQKSMGQPLNSVIE